MNYSNNKEYCPNCGNLDIEFDNDERGCYCCGFSWKVFDYKIVK